jgi:hypothetical protein
MNLAQDRKATHWIRFILILLLLFVVVTLLLKTKTTTLKSPFELEASEQWIIRQDRPGEVIARHTLGRRQAIQGMKVYRYERNDLITMDLHTNLTEGASVPVGFPVLIINSLNDNSQEHILEAREKRMTEQVNILTKGPYQARIIEAERQLDLSQTNFITFLPEYARVTNLVNRGISSQYERDIARQEHARLLQEIRIARESLNVRKMEIAPGIITMAELELEETQHELAMVRSRITNRWLKTPIPGRLTRSSGDPDILLRIVNEHKVYARIIIPLAFYELLHIGDAVDLRFHGKELLVRHTKIEYIIVESIPMLGQSVLHVLVPLDNDDGELSVAMTGQALFPEIKIDPFNMLLRRMRYALSRPNTTQHTPQ